MNKLSPLKFDDPSDFRDSHRTCQFPDLSEYDYDTNDLGMIVDQPATESYTETTSNVFYLYPYFFVTSVFGWNTWGGTTDMTAVVTVETVDQDHIYFGGKDDRDWCRGENTDLVSLSLDY
jgi:hypothetical protein